MTVYKSEILTFCFVIFGCHIDTAEQQRALNFELLRKSSRLQLIQNSAPSVARQRRQCDIGHRNWTWSKHIWIISWIGHIAATRTKSTLIYLDVWLSSLKAVPFIYYMVNMRSEIPQNKKKVPICCSSTQYKKNLIVWLLSLEIAERVVC